MQQTPAHDGYNADLLDVVPLGATKLVEVGCGSGAFARAYKALNPDAFYTGLDVVSSYVDMASPWCDQALCLNIEQATPSFWKEVEGADCWIFGDTLEHLADPWQLLVRIRASIPSDGCIAACIPNMQHWSVVHRLITGELHYEDQGLLDRTHLRWFTVKTMQTLFIDCGFKIESITPRIFNEPPRQQIAPVLNQLALSFGATEVDRYDFFSPLQYIIKAVPSK